MIIIGLACDQCSHRMKNADGWKAVCDAFPDGIPIDLMFKSDPSKLKECNNGIGYEEKKKSKDKQRNR